MKLYDSKRMVAIEMREGNKLDWSQDFFEVGKLAYSEYLDAYKVEDVDYCIEQAMDWKTADGDFYEPDADPADRTVIVEEISMKTYEIIYRMRPDSEDEVITFRANTIEGAIAFAKNYRQDAFSIYEKDAFEVEQNEN